MEAKRDDMNDLSISITISKGDKKGKQNQVSTRHPFFSEGSFVYSVVDNCIHLRRPIIDDDKNIITPCHNVRKSKKTIYKFNINTIDAGFR